MIKYYAVAVGRETGIYKTWDGCKKNVDGFSGARFKSFKSQKEAEDFIFTHKLQEEKVASLKMDVLKEEEDAKIDKANVVDKAVEEDADMVINYPKKDNKLKRSIDQVEITPTSTKEIRVLDAEPNLKKTKTKEAEDTLITKVITPKFTRSYLNVYTDGACSKNGSKDACVGIGVFFENKEMGYKDISKRIGGKQTNNTGELSAILEALNVADLEQDVLIHTDSEYAIRGILGINRVHANKELFDAIGKRIKDRSVLGSGTGFKKVKGHSGKMDGNYYADKLATDALK